MLSLLFIMLMLFCRKIDCVVLMVMVLWYCKMELLVLCSYWFELFCYRLVMLLLLFMWLKGLVCW